MKEAQRAFRHTNLSQSSFTSKDPCDMIGQCFHLLQVVIVHDEHSIRRFNIHCYLDEADELTLKDDWLRI